jgi:hypothetical protein
MTKSDLVAFVSRCLAVVETDVVTLERWSMDPALPFQQRAMLSMTRGRLVGFSGAREVALAAANAAAAADVPGNVRDLRPGREPSLLAAETIADALGALNAAALMPADLYNRSQMLELDANAVAHLAETVVEEALA